MHRGLDARADSNVGNGSTDRPSTSVLRLRPATFLALSFALASCGLLQPEVEADVAPIRDDELWGATFDKSRAVCGSGNYLHGIDVSTYQGTINWTSVAGAGVAYTFIRSSYGMSGVDGKFDTNWAGAKAAGIPRGAYHYFNPDYSGVTQANHMLAQFVDGSDLGELPIVLDVEDSTTTATMAEHAARVGEFLDTIRTSTGHAVMIYSGGHFWDTYVKSNAFSDVPIWVAHYFNDRSTAHCPNTPDDWTRWTFWQHSEMGTVAGISGAVDLDVFDGTMAELLALAAPVHQAKYVTQSFPLASQGTLRIELGSCVDASITLRNIGTAPWTSAVELALSSPRDQPMPAVESPMWISPTRLDAVTGTVAVNGTYAFAWQFCGNTLGTHSVRMNLVDGPTWFSDPGQGGPADTVIQALVEVVPPGGGTDAGVDPDAGTVTTDAGIDPNQGDGGVCMGAACAPTRRHGGCSVGVPRSDAPTGALVFIACVALALSRRRSAAPTLR